MFFCSITTPSTTELMKYLTSGITALLRIRLYQLSLPNHCMVNMIVKCAQVRLFIFIIDFNIQKAQTKKKRKDNLLNFGKHGNAEIKQSSAIYHLLRHYGDVTPAIL